MPGEGCPAAAKAQRNLKEMSGRAAQRSEHTEPFSEAFVFATNLETSTGPKLTCK